jgi:CRISPR-associated endonuclease/helicase Cas3
MSRKFYAHSLPGRPPEEWQPLEEHLRKVAKMARGFAEPFGGGDWAYLAGLWHDLGKYSLEFQSYLNCAADIDASTETMPGRIDHSSAGAQHAVQSTEIIGHLIAYMIAGHHSGLLDGRDTGACQETRLHKALYSWTHGLQVLPPFRGLEPPDGLRKAFSELDGFAAGFFTRMVFSCLVDADFLDTESFMHPGQDVLRKSWPDTVMQRMDDALNEFVGKLNLGDTLVNRQRASVRKDCLTAALRKPGLFSLTVPTGGGKTLASLAFALRHAMFRGLQRIIYVIPLTSIIEQNAEVFRQAFKPVSDQLGREVVLEHHSSLDPDGETAMNRLAAENWDAPLIVTTSVQFYESLFASKTSRCRKLHRLARSVIILDEAQTLPVEYLKPCLRALQELVTNYKTSIVICTATQPAIELREGFEIGMNKPIEITSNPVELYRRLQRVEVEDLGDQVDEELKARMMTERQALCIVNTRLHAGRLLESLGTNDGHFHLSGNMCPAHRSEKLKGIRKYLDECRMCRVVSTQVIEAGVDVDFPVVFRSLAGLDSIAQAAGRCNRNGKLKDKGRTYIFRSEHTKAEKFFADTAQCAAQVLSLYRNPLELDAVKHYFELYYWDQQTRWDLKGIVDEFHLLRNERSFPFNFMFARVSHDFQLIDDAGYVPIVIPWGEEGQKFCKKLRAMPFSTIEIRRKLQRFVVQVPRWAWERHVNTDIQLVHGINVLISPEIHYSEDTGLNLEAEGPGAIFG